ncbi:hypothetical protein [Roseivirga pacifica]|uniref:hypothetical protein n=1 Tax=Roseivirga pacifica TaxID=1267423 RepID=UPI003BA9A3D2
MSNAEINTIREYLKQHGFSNVALIDDLVDHLATEIELIQADNGADFEEAFTSAKEKLLPETPHELEIDLKLLTTQKHNIMIKKIAFIGGYLSALCLCMAVLFFAQSFQPEKNGSRMVEAIQADREMSRAFSDYEPRFTTEDYKSSNQKYVELKISAYKKYKLSEVLLTISIIIFVTTYVPYQFYARYQRSELELLAS